MVCLPQILIQNLGETKTVKGNFQNVDVFSGQTMGRMQLLKQFFRSDVTSVEMLNQGDMHKEAEQVKMWLQTILSFKTKEITNHGISNMVGN